MNPASAHAAEERDAAGGDPFGDEDVAVLVEAGVVGMDELAVHPALGLGADLEAVEHLLGPLGVVSQVGEDLVVLVEQADPGVEVGDEQDVAADVEMGRERDVVQLADVRAVEGEVLEPGVGAVGDDQAGVAAGAPVAAGTAGCTGAAG